MPHLLHLATSRRISPQELHQSYVEAALAFSVSGGQQKKRKRVGRENTGSSADRSSDASASGSAASPADAKARARLAREMVSCGVDGAPRLGKPTPSCV